MEKKFTTKPLEFVQSYFYVFTSKAEATCMQDGISEHKNALSLVNHLWIRTIVRCSFKHRCTTGAVKKPCCGESSVLQA